MLSAESATGNYPLLAVKSMEKIITSVERTSNEIYFKFEKRKKLKDRLSESLINVACRLSDQISAKALVTMTKSGYSAYRVSGSRPKAKIYIITNDKKTGNELNLLWGVRAIYYDKNENIDSTFENIEKLLVNAGHLSKNDKYIITSSMPTHWKGHTNMMKINVVEL
jgi:pyruvate kinase